MANALHSSRSHTGRSQPLESNAIAFSPHFLNCLLSLTSHLSGRAQEEKYFCEIFLMVDVGETKEKFPTKRSVAVI